MAMQVKAMVFPVVMYGCEIWTVKKAEHRRIDAFELWYWRRLLRVLWTARRSNQSILKEISPGCSLEGMILKLKLQYFGHLMRRVDSLEKTDAGRDWGQEKGTTENEMAGWHHRLYGCEFEWTLGVGDRQGGLACCNSWGCKESDMNERLNWAELNWTRVDNTVSIYFLQPKNSKNIAMYCVLSIKNKINQDKNKILTTSLYREHCFILCCTLTLLRVGGFNRLM